MKYETVILEKKDHIATVTLNRPEKLNAENDQLLLELQRVWEELDIDDEIRVAVLTGAGRAFCAGGDVKEELGAATDWQKGGKDWFWSRFRQVPSSNRPTGISYQDMEKLTKPIIASINGPAAGGGVVMALRCDIRIASEAATFLPGAYIRMGIAPLRLLYYLPRAVGMGAACHLMFTGKRIDAKEALRIGLVDQVVPANELATATYEEASRIAELPPIAMRIIKRNLYVMRDTNFEVARHIGGLSFPITTQTEDYAEAVSAFVEKRKPVFKGR